MGNYTLLSSTHFLFKPNELFQTKLKYSFVGFSHFCTSTLKNMGVVSAFQMMERIPLDTNGGFAEAKGVNMI